LKETEAPEILKDLGPLNGLAGDVRFLPVLGKKPYGADRIEATNWNRNPAKWLTAPQIYESRALGRWPSIGLMTGSRVGGYCWLDFDGKKVDERTGEIICGKHTFNELTNHQLTQEDLLKHYKSPVNISGKKDRMRILYRIPAKYADELSSKSYDQGKLEIIYEATERGQRHGVIEGQHPDEKEDGKDLYYRWLDGYSPEELEVADLPEPVIEGWLKKINEQVKEENKTDNSPTFFDYLSPGEQKKLIYDMMPFLPYRDAVGGTYRKCMRIALSLWRGIGDRQIFTDWIVGSEWDLKSDWDGTKYNRKENYVNGGALLPWVESLIASPTDDSKKIDKWGSAWSLAEKNGWVLPKWAKHCLPPKILAEGLIEKSAKMAVELTEAIKSVEDSDISPSQRLLVMQNLRKELKISKPDFTQVITSLQTEIDGEDTGRLITATQLMEEDDEIEVLVPRLLAKGSLTLLAADSGCGKSAFLYRLMEAITTGNTFAGEFHIPRTCKVLLIQKDEPKLDTKAKWRLQSLQHDKSKVLVQHVFHPGMLVELRRDIEETGVELVLMDSFFTLFGGTTNMNDPEMGLYIYMLNKIASDLNVCIVLTHHLRKDQSKERPGELPVTRPVTKADLYGSTYLVSGSSTVLGMYKEYEQGMTLEQAKDFPKIALKVLKNRNGVCETGEKFVFQGCAEDMSFEFESFNGGTHTLSELDKLRDQILKILCVRVEPETALTLDELRGLLKGSFSAGAIRKEAMSLLQNAVKTGIVRYKEKKSKAAGRPSWRYYKPV